MSRGWRAAFVIGLLSSQSLLAQRQVTPTPSAAARQGLALRSALQQALGPSGIDVPDQRLREKDIRTQELRIAWPYTAGAGSLVPASAGLRVISRVRDASPFPRLRAFELAEDTLLLAAVDAAGRLRGWSVIPDPRFVRVEVPGPDGVLTGQVVRVALAEFLAPIPDDPAVVEVRLFETRRAATGLVLEWLATLVVPEGEGRVR